MNFQNKHPTYYYLWNSSKWQRELNLECLRASLYFIQKFDGSEKNLINQYFLQDRIDDLLAELAQFSSEIKAE